MSRLTIEDVLKLHTPVDQEYKFAVKHFRPRFGSDDGIAIRDAIEHVNELVHKANLIIDAKRGGQSALLSVIRAKQHVLSMMTFAKR